MPGENDCQLYVDGNLEDTDSNVGAGSINGFNGMLDDLIHWDDYDLDESGENEVTDLFNTNYGIDAHLLDFEIKIVDEFGIDLGISNKTISQTFNVPVAYSSDQGEYATPISDNWGQYNFTAITTEERVVDFGERLMINMTYAPKNSGNLNMKMVIDDTDVLSGLGNSFLQIPLPDIGLPGYGAYDNSARGTISIFNPGPTDNWIKYQSRVIFEDELTGSPYAAFIDNSDGSPISPDQDSPPILEGSTAVFEFERPRAQPGNLSSELIPEGRYRMFVFLDGYDSSGNIFLQTTSLGVVRVT
ncbi:MAG: hypothetical protein ACW99A_23675 [Candidatus Kariarchaeaceae archaeon]|jgi:hypothetical protein